MASKLWRDRYPMVDPGHGLELDARAAIHEIAEGHPRSLAESKAYEQYVKTHLTHSAAHHLSGIRASMASGNHDAAREHALHYHLLATALGFPAHGEPPAQIASLARDHSVTPVYQFKNHGADAVVLEHIRKKSTKDVARLSKSEGEITPPCGHLVESGPGGEMWELTHLLGPERRAAGERLLVHEAGGRRAVHHLLDRAGQSIPLASFAEGAGGLEPTEGEPAADVRRAAALAVRSRRAAVGASIASGARAVDGLVGGLG